MKGIILAGGMGTRLYPLTKVTNKCLLPVYDRPMIHWPIQTLVKSGIKDILLVCGGGAAGEFLRILGNGEEFGLKRLHYTYQKEASGIAHALSLAEEFANNEPVCVVLADNVIEDNLSKDVEEFRQNPEGAKIFLTKVEHPEWYGVVETDSDGKVLEIVEKPKIPKTNMIAVGIYMYDQSVWSMISELRPSQRNELEITDLNTAYLKRGKLKSSVLKGRWMDCGESLEGYHQAQIAVAEMEKQRKSAA
jgi:glucose-1-phosphate thymidylyltransferase